MAYAVRLLDLRMYVHRLLATKIIPHMLLYQFLSMELMFHQLQIWQKLTNTFSQSSYKTMKLREIHNIIFTNIYEKFVQ